MYHARNVLVTQHKRSVFVFGFFIIIFYFFYFLHYYYFVVFIYFICQIEASTYTVPFPGIWHHCRPGGRESSGDEEFDPHA